MIKTLLLLLVAVYASHAQITSIQGSDTIAGSRTTINNNFSYLDQHKAGLGQCDAHKFAVQTQVGGIVCASLQLGDLPTITTSNVGEGTNLYFTAARAQAALAGMYQIPITGAPSSWPSSFVPSTHASTHGNAGSDPISLDASQIATGIFAIGRIPTGTTSSTVALGNHNHSGVYEPVISAGSSTQYWRGDKTWQTLDTSIVPENGNLYFSNARAQAALSGMYQNPITGAPGAWPTSFNPSAHASSHAANGSDPITPSSIGAESTSNKGQANGYPSLGSDGKVPANQLPSTSTSSPYIGSFTSATTVTVTGATHGYQTAALTVTFQDNSTPRNVIYPNTLTINPTTYDVVATFSTPQTGFAIVNGGVGAQGSMGTLTAAQKVRVCEVTIGDPGAGSPFLASDNNSPSVCGNKSGQTMTVTAVECFANAGAPTVLPIITSGSSTSLLTGALTCGTNSFASGTLNGTPTLINNASIDANFATVDGTAKYVVMRFTLTL